MGGPAAPGYPAPDTPLGESGRPPAKQKEFDFKTPRLLDLQNYVTMIIMREAGKSVS